MREVGQGSSWGTLSSCPHEFTFEFAFNLNETFAKIVC